MSGMGLLDVVIVYAFDSTTPTLAWDKVDHEIFWLVHEKLKCFQDCCLGYIYVMSSPNTCTSDIKKLDSSETSETGYEDSFAKSTTACVKNMACGLSEAHKLISYRGHWNAIILIFSDGFINGGDFFDGAEKYISKVPVHTFTLGGDAYNHVLAAIAANSPGGTFRLLPVPEEPSLSVTFSRELDSILDGTTHPSNNSERFPRKVVLVYACDCTDTTQARDILDNQVYWMVHEKLQRFPDSCLGYTYSESGTNTYTSEIKNVDSSETPETEYECSSVFSTAACRKNMASGLSVAHELINSKEQFKTIILLFSDGLMNEGDFFDGAEKYISKVPVHTFTLGGDAYNHVLAAIAANSPGGTFRPLPVPDEPSMSVTFSRELDSILDGTNHPSNNSEGFPLKVVLVYACDCTNTNPAWDKLDNQIYWMVHEKLKRFPDSCLGYTYSESGPNTYTSEIKKVDSSETSETEYEYSSVFSTAACRENMASGLSVAHELINSSEHFKKIILLFSDGLINEGDFFDGAEKYISEIPVHTFTLGGDAYNNVLATIAANSPDGTFRSLPLPDEPSLSVTFSHELDSILDGTSHPSNNSERFPLNVVLVYACDCTNTTPAREKLDNQVYWMVHEKLQRFPDSCLGYTYCESGPNTYTSEIKKVDSSETPETEYECSSVFSTAACRKNMASGLSVAHELINSSEHFKTIILLFSDGFINKGDFFDGAEDFISKVPVYTFTLGGDEYNDGLQAMAENSPGGMFNLSPVPEKPMLSVPFSRLLDDILHDNWRRIIDDHNKLNVLKEDGSLLMGELSEALPVDQ